MTLPNEKSTLLKDKLRNLLHPSQIELLNNVRISPYIHHLQRDKGVLSTADFGIHEFVGVIVRGTLGVKHDFETRGAITHFYQKGDLILSLEIDEALNRQGTFWQIYEEVDIVLLPLQSKQWQSDYPQCSSTLITQASLMAAYVYQKHINNLGLDRKSYSVNWLRENKRLLGLVPRADLANYLDISKTSLKSFIKIALLDG